MVVTDGGRRNKKELAKYAKKYLPWRPKMTCILGAKCIDGVALVADRIIKNEEDGRVSYRDKLFCDYYPTVIGAAGSEILSTKFRPQAVKAAQEASGNKEYTNISGVIHMLPPPPPEPTISIAKYLKELETISRNINKEYSTLAGAPFNILLGVQTKDGGARLHYISEKGVSEDVYDYKVIGSSEPHSRVFLRQLWRQEMTMKDFGELGYFTIKLIERHGVDPNVGVGIRKPQLWYVPNTGELEGHNDETLEELDDRNQQRLSKYNDFMFELFKTNPDYSSAAKIV